MGWAICSPQDTYDEKAGIELCKKRFRKSPLTAKTGLFLTNDMVNAILDNEVNYIKAHWGKFVPNDATNAQEEEKTFELIFDDELGPDKEVVETEPDKEITESTQEATEETLVNDKTETPETEATFNEGTFVTFKSDKENGWTIYKPLMARRKIRFLLRCRQHQTFGGFC